MTTVQKYIELPDTFNTDEEALGYLSDHMGLTNWQAICDVRSRSQDGAVLDMDFTLGGLYFDEELQVYLYSVSKMREVYKEEEVPTSELDEDGNIVFNIFSWTQVEPYVQLRAVSFLPEADEGEDAPES